MSAETVGLVSSFGTSFITPRCTCSGEAHGSCDDREPHGLWGDSPNFWGADVKKWSRTLAIQRKQLTACGCWSLALRNHLDHRPPSRERRPQRKKEWKELGVSELVIQHRNKQCPIQFGVLKVKVSKMGRFHTNRASRLSVGQGPWLLCPRREGATSDWEWRWMK